MHSIYRLCIPKVYPHSIRGSHQNFHRLAIRSLQTLSKNCLFLGLLFVIDFRSQVQRAMASMPRSLPLNSCTIILHSLHYYWQPIPGWISWITFERWTIDKKFQPNATYNRGRQSVLYTYIRIKAQLSGRLNSPSLTHGKSSAISGSRWIRAHIDMLFII